MKKFLIPVVAFAAFLMVSCSGGSPIDKAIGVIEDATAKVEKAESAEEIEKIGKEVEAKMAELEKEYKDLDEKDISDADKEKVQKAVGDFAAAAMKKAVELGGSDALGL